MNEKQKFSELVRQAQEGQEEPKNRLACEAESRLRAYIYRVTLDYNLALDLSQEGLLEMVKSLGNLKNVHRFWPWLYGIAHSKIQQHYREKRRRAEISASVFYDGFLSQRAGQVTDNGLRQLLQEEMSKTVITAMRDMKQQHRAVLSLRCFDELPYADVALAMQCSETKARVLFFRAKQALKRQLGRRGVSKSLLLMCLGLFGKLTASAEAAPAAVSVSAASAKVGLSTAILAATTSKVGVATVAAAVIGLGT
ncbi:MAG: RNA polymerase sigma factor, partial [Planctomycetota bacterium]